MNALKKILVSCSALLLSFSCAHADSLYEAAYDGVALRTRPDAHAKVIDRAKKGWKLHAVGASDGEWAEICEIDSGDGPWYAYRMYGLPGENVFASRTCLKKHGDPRPVPREKLLAQVRILLDDLVHLSVRGTNVRLRRGPGTEHEITGRVSAGDFGGELIAWKEKTAAKDGRLWYRLLYRLERQEETAYLDADDYICADFAKASPLTDRDRERIESGRFRILNISPEGLPRFSLKEPLKLLGDPFDAERSVLVDAGTDMTLFTIPYRRTGDTGLHVELWEPADRSRIRRLGSMPLDELEALSRYPGEEQVRKWLASHASGVRVVR